MIIKKGKFQVVRDCCTSGNCFGCTRVTPFGVSQRIVHMDNLSKETAEEVARNFASYDANVERMPVKA